MPPASRILKIALILLAISAIAGVALVVWYEPDPYARMSDEEILAAADEFYQTRPYYERPFPHTEVPEGLPDLRSETCATCHGEIHEEWSISTHARAWEDDPQFMEELAKARGEYYEDQDGDYGWMCVNCHTPMVNQLEQLVVDLEDGDISRPVYVDNPTYDEELQLDAIGCASCHVEDATVYGPHGDTDAPHPTAHREELENERVCTQCHQAEAMFPEQNLGCFFTTGSEWEKSPAAEDGMVCQDCHMPREHRPAAEVMDAPDRDVARHWFGGSLIAKQPDFKEEIAPLRKIFGSGGIISLESPDGDCDPQENGCAPPAVRVHNRFAGHLFPTGDPERHVDVRIAVRNDSGDVVSEAFERIGSKYEWYPEIELQWDNRIAPGESKWIDVDWPDEFDELIVEIEGDKYRMYEDDFDYHELEGRYVRGREFHRSEWIVREDGAVELEWIADDFGEREVLEPDNTPPENRP